VFHGRGWCRYYDESDYAGLGEDPSRRWILSDYQSGILGHDPVYRVEFKTKNISLANTLPSTVTIVSAISLIV
jgi:hypothetical protein